MLMERCISRTSGTGWRCWLGLLRGWTLLRQDRNLTLLARQDQAADARFPDLTKEPDQDEVLKKAASIRAELLVICDNFDLGGGGG